MAQRTPRLRLDLDFLPSPVADRPGLLLRDPFHYSDAALIIPPVLVQCLQLFDGEHDDLDIRALLTRLTGELDVGGAVDHLLSALGEAGFLEDERYESLKERRRAAFAEAPVREASQAGAGYPENAAALRAALAGWLNGAETTKRDRLVGLAAPHVSPDGGWESYRAAYSALPVAHRDRVFVALGTSHYGEPDRFGLTRKPFVTPLGQTTAEPALVDWLAEHGGEAVKMEDYCHAVEHSIEFQVVFLQHVLGPDVRILPILCGAFVRGVLDGGRPEADAGVERFLKALAELSAREGDRLFWVLGVDMAHMGRRYGDAFTARAGEGPMAGVETADRRRIERLAAGDADGFWDAVKKNPDELKWCGSAPFYTFLRAVPDVRGELLHYQQWNIDEQSVVSFGALAFERG